MMARQLLAARDTDHRRIGQPVGQQFIQLHLALVVEVGGGLIEEQPFWPLQQSSRERDALLVRS